ncbi:MAG: YbaB/EbfC family nucleoid-associated protein [Betaproteobacteria bacterium]|nr:YbaB/EbfC family nucleoid-associated protein [Betaproteobacteria bacterium]
MKGNIGQMMKQAQMMQENMRRLQEQFGGMEVEGQSASGMVKIVLTCKYQVRRVSIDPSLTSDREMLEDLLVAAFNDAARQVETTVAEKMGSLSAGMGLPAGLKLPF